MRLKGYGHQTISGCWFDRPARRPKSTPVIWGLVRKSAWPIELYSCIVKDRSQVAVYAICQAPLNLSLVGLRVLTVFLSTILLRHIPLIRRFVTNECRVVILWKIVSARAPSWVSDAYNVGTLFPSECSKGWNLPGDAFGLSWMLNCNAPKTAG